MAPKLTGPQIEQLRLAILDAFHEKDELAAIVRITLEQSLDTISTQSGLNTVVFELIQYVETKGLTEQLVQGALKENPNNQLLQAFVRQHLHVPVTSAVVRERQIIPSPYPGLQHYDENFAQFFYGRDAEINQAIEYLQKSHLLIVLGPSGAGKSSLIYGGLLPHLQQLGGPSLPWAMLSMRPTVEPANQLERKLRGVLSDPEQAVVRYLADTKGAQRLLLIVDQFEEIFTLASEEERNKLLVVLSRLSKLPTCIVMLILHTSFLDELMEANQLSGDQFIRLDISPLRDERLREAIEKPALKSGVEFEAGLLALLVRDAADEPGRLPLVQATLQYLWRTMSDGVLRLATYQQLDHNGRRGISAALAHIVDEAVMNLTSQEFDAAHRIFLRLVQFVPGRPETRRQQPLSDLRIAGEPPTLITQTANKLAAQGLLVQDKKDADKVVDLAHEILITAWPRYQEWLEDDREDEQKRREFEAKAVRWLRFNKHGGLLDLVELREVEEWLSQVNRTIFGPSDELTSLIAVSRATYHAEVIANHAMNQLEQDPELGLLLAVEAVTTMWRLGHRPPPRAEAALHDALFRTADHRILPGHTAPIRQVIYSADDHYVATASDDGTARIWYPAEGWSSRVLRGHSGPVRAVAFSPEGSRMCVTAGDDGTARIWLTDSGQEHAVLQAHKSALTSVAYSPDGKSITTAGVDSTVRTWDWQTGKQLRSYQTGRILTRSKGAHSGIVHSVSYSHDGRTIVTAGDDATIRVWSVKNGQRQLQLLGHVNAVLSAVYSHDGRTILSSGEDGTARVWDAVIGQPLLTLFAHACAVTSAAYSRNDERIVTASEEGEVTIWDAAMGTRLTTLPRQSAPITSVAFSPDDTQVVATGADNTVVVWDLPPGSYCETSSFNSYNQWSVAYSPNPQTQSVIVASSGYSSAARTNQATILYTRAGSVQERKLLLHHHGQFGLRGAAYSPDGKYIITAGEDKTARIWDASTHKEHHLLTEHPDIMIAATYSRRGTYIVTASKNGTVRIWDAKNLAQIRNFTHEGGITQAAFSHDEQKIATAGIDHTVHIWDVTDAHPPIVLSGHTSEVTDVAWSPDGRYLASSGQDRVVRIWDITANFERHTLGGHTGNVTALTYSPDGQMIATASADKTARLWNADTGKEWVTLRGHTAPVDSLVYTPDGMRLVTVSTKSWGKGELRQYLIDIDALLALAAKRLNRQLSPEERTTFLAEAG